MDTTQTRYIDGVKTRIRRSRGEFAGVIEAYSYPNDLYETVRNQRLLQSFDFSYRVMNAERYKIHLVYNALISPAGFLYRHSETGLYSWSFTTTPTPVPGAALSAHLVIDTSLAYSWTVAALEDILYGTEAEGARLPSPAEVFDIFEENSILRVIDHGDGTFTVEGPDEAIQMLDTTIFEITWPSAVYIDAVSYTIHSL